VENEPSPSILVTGATGFIGRSVMARLRREGIDAHPYHGRINNYLALREQLEGKTAVIHLAGSEMRGRNRLLNHVDIEGTERLLEECRRAGIQRLIVISRIGADPNSLHKLLAAKGKIEKMVRQSEIPATIIRSASVYGFGDRYFEMILGISYWSFPFAWVPGGGERAWQPLWVEDLARCLVATLDRPDLIGKTVTVAGEEHLPYKEILRRILAVAGVRRLPVKLPMTLLRPLSRLLFWWWYWPPATSYFVDRFFTPEAADFDTVRRTFGFQPARLDHTINYLRRPGLRWRIFRR
jgi:NADH dehydrogenase